MKNRFAYLLFVVLVVASLFYTNVAFGKTEEKTQAESQIFNNIALCYHGFTTNAGDIAEYVTYLEDFKEQINHLKNKGYSFVFPSEYSEQYLNKHSLDTPIATIIFDDARDSVDIAADWLIKNKIPFGIAIIGKRLGKIDPEDGYMSWTSINRIYDSGYCEILNHTYNMHHFNLKNENGAVVSAPILEGPGYVDHADYIYIDEDDSRWYWDLTYVDGITWAFPLFGTDTITNQPLESTITFVSKKNVNVNKIRVWSALHKPYSSGYNAIIQIAINGTTVANKTINTTQYETRSQWPEREFVTIDFDKSYTLEANNSYSITFKTLNAGDSSFTIYAIPDFSGDYELTTTSTGMSFGAGNKWPAKACVILAGNNGKSATEKEFEEYVLNDLSMNNQVVNKYLGANWSSYSTRFEEDEALECLVLGGTYTNGSLASTSIKYTPAKSFTGEIMRLKSVSHIGDWYPLIIDVFIDGQKVSRFSPDWQDWSWQTITIEPYQFSQGQEYDITFKTINKSPNGTGLVRIYMDQQDLPWPAWDQENNTWAEPDVSRFQYFPQYEVSSPEGTDVYPSGIIINNMNYDWSYSSPYTGPGKAFLEILSLTPGPGVTPTQICYPFGSYQSTKTDNKQDISPVLKKVLRQIGVNSGMAVWDEAAINMENIDSEYSEYVIPRYLVLGNLGQSRILRDIDILIGEE